VRAQTRHQLKQDRFAEATGETVQWAVQHQKKLIIVAVVIAVVAAAALGSWYYEQNQDSAASGELGAALNTYSAPLRPAGMPPDPQFQTFTSTEERAKAAQPEFRAIVEKYRHTNSAQIAQYFLGLTDIDLGDNAGAERELKAVSGARNHDVSSLAKLALAALYHDTNRDSQAIELYKDLIAHPTRTVSKARAQLELATLYQTKDPQEARRILEQVSKDNPGSPAAQIANMQMGGLK